MQDWFLRTSRYIERSPAWIKPGLVGASFIYLSVIRRGLIFVPFALAVLLFTDLRMFVMAVAALFVVIPATGFLAGMSFGVVGLATRGLGKPGQIIQFIAATWTYCVLLVFFVMPWIDPEMAHGASSGERWFVASVLGVIFGFAMALGALTDL